MNHFETAASVVSEEEDCNGSCSCPEECGLIRSFETHWVDTLLVLSSGLNSEKIVWNVFKRDVQSVIQMSDQKDQEKLRHLFTSKFEKAFHMLLVRICDVKYFLNRVLPPNTFMKPNAWFVEFDREFTKEEKLRFKSNGEKCADLQSDPKFQKYLMYNDLHPHNDVSAIVSDDELTGYAWRKRLNLVETEYNKNVVKEIKKSVQTTLLPSLIQFLCHCFLDPHFRNSNKYGSNISNQCSSTCANEKSDIKSTDTFVIDFMESLRQHCDTAFVDDLRCNKVHARSANVDQKPKQPKEKKLKKSSLVTPCASPLLLLGSAESGLSAFERELLIPTERQMSVFSSFATISLDGQYVSVRNEVTASSCDEDDDEIESFAVDEHIGLITSDKTGLVSSILQV